MSLKTFKYSGNWFKRAWIYFSYWLRGYYIANTPAEVPFYRQLTRKGKVYELKDGTRCYIADSNIVVELHKDRWFALGNSVRAKALNSEIDDYVNSAELDPDQLLAEMRKYINQGNQSVAERIIQKELDAAGVVIIPAKDFNN